MHALQPLGNGMETSEGTSECKPTLSVNKAKSKLTQTCHDKQLDDTKDLNDARITVECTGIKN